MACSRELHILCLIILLRSVINQSLASKFWQINSIYPQDVHTESYNGLGDICYLTDYYLNFVRMYWQHIVAPKLNTTNYYRLSL